jgi:hypothetical protein
LNSGTRCARLYDPPELPARRQERAAAATFYAAVVCFHIGIDDRWRAAVRAREFVRHRLLSPVNVTPIGVAFQSAVD